MVFMVEGTTVAIFIGDGLSSTHWIGFLTVNRQTSLRPGVFD